MSFSNTNSVVAADLNNCLRGLNRDNSTYTVTGTTAETDMAPLSITGGTIGATGALHVIAAGTITGSAGTKRIRLYLGATAIGDTTAVTGTADWMFDVWIFNTSSSAQRCIVNWADHQNATNFNHDYITAATDTASTQTLKLTGTLGNSADSIVQTVFDVFVAQVT